MNNIREIDRLLALFYEGEISPDDMAKLAALMREADSLPERLAADKAMILALDNMAQRETAVPEGLEARLTDAIDEADRKQRSPKRIHIMIRHSLAIAASLALVAVAAWVVLSRPANEMAQSMGSGETVVASTDTRTRIDSVAQTDTVITEAPVVKPVKQRPISVASAKQTDKKVENQTVNKVNDIDAKELSARVIRFANEVSNARSSTRMAMELMAVNMRIVGEKFESAGETVGVVGNALNSIPKQNNIIQ